MKYTQLGRTGLKVSRICLGTMNFGVRTDEKTSFAIMDRALELNINFFDTANRYGDPQGGGGTETIIGKWLAQGDRRDRIVLATKAFGPMGPGANDGNLSAYHLRQASEDSLRRLQTDRIDLYQMHHVDRGTPHFRASLDFIDGDRSNLTFPAHVKPGARWEEIWQAMGHLIDTGKIIYVGSSNFAAWNIAQACERASARNMFGLVSEQSLYNLTERSIELEVIPAAREYGLGVIPWSPLGGGLLAGLPKADDSGRRKGLKVEGKRLEQMNAYDALCKEIGEEPAVVALAWLLHNPVVTAPIIGPRTMEQLESAIRATELTLDAEILDRLDEIWPGPGDQAPEAYAW